MDGLRDFLNDLRRHGYAQGNLLGLLHILIGRRVQKHDGTLLTSGLNWRSLAELLRRVRWNKEAVRDLGVDPASLPPRDRLRYWYLAIGQAGIDSPKAVRAGDQLAEILRAAGYIVSAAPVDNKHNETGGNREDRGQS
jgi:hypothetical protein